MDINKFIDSIENKTFNKIINSKSDAEARRLLKEHQALQLLQPDVIKSVCNDELDCPFDFTSRCTMGRCDCKPKQTVL